MNARPDSPGISPNQTEIDNLIQLMNDLPTLDEIEITNSLIPDQIHHFTELANKLVAQLTFYTTSKSSQISELDKEKASSAYAVIDQVFRIGKTGKNQEKAIAELFKKALRQALNLSISEKTVTTMNLKEKGKTELQSTSTLFQSVKKNVQASGGEKISSKPVSEEKYTKSTKTTVEVYGQPPAYGTTSDSWRRRQPPPSLIAKYTIVKSVKTIDPPDDGKIVSTLNKKILIKTSPINMDRQISDKWRNPSKGV